MIMYVAPRGEEFTLGYYLEDRGGPLRDRVRFVYYEDLESCTSLEAGAWIFSGLDRVSPAQRELADVVWRRLDSSGLPVRLLNRPNRVLLRAPLLTALHEAGINDFRALSPRERFGPLRFPVFLREKDAHTGNLSPLLNDRTSLEGALTRLRLLGYELDELLVVEFLDTSDADGIYRKYSSYMVDGVVIPKALRFGTEWMLKARSSFWDDAKVREQETWAENNGWADELASVFRLAHIDYGRVDYSVVDGRVQVWEINMNPTVTRGTGTNKPEAMKAMKAERAKVSQAFHSAFRELLLDLEPDTWGDLSVPFVAPADVLDRIERERQVRARAHEKKEARRELATRLGRLRPSLPGFQKARRDMVRQAR